MKLVHLLVPIVLASVMPGAASAQRQDYQALRDSIAQVTDVPLLRRMQARLDMPGLARGLEPIVRRGLLGQRIYELTGERDDFEAARDAFERAVERFPREVWSHYGLALVLSHGPDVRLPLVGGVLPGVTLGQTVAEIFRRDPASRARRELRQTLALEPGFGPAAVLLARLALSDARSREQVREARAALEQARAAGDHSADVARALADTETALGNYEAAAKAASAGGSEDPGALRSRGIALMLQSGNDEAGFALYRRAIERLDANTANLLYEDVAALLNAQEAADWKVAETLPAKQAWLVRFWDRRAAEAGVTPAERVAEHYHRLALARASYVRNARRGSENTGAMLGEKAVAEHPFDDRGVVLIRHGLPARVVTTTQRGLLPNETWVYVLPNQGQQLFHFVALRGAQDYAIVGNLMDAVDPRASLELPDRIMAVTSLVEDRATYDPQYRAAIGRLRNALGEGSGMRSAEVREPLERAEANYRRGARVALRSDSYSRPYSGVLAFAYDLFTFRTPFKRTDLTVAFALPAEQLEPLVGSSGSEYALRLSVILTDTLQDVVTRTDTAVTVRVAGPLGRGDYVRTFVTLPVLPSEHTVYRVVAEDAVGGRGQVMAGGARLRDYAGSGLQVSDAVLALADSAGEWRRGDVALSLALPRRFGPDRPFSVFYEVYNLPAETPYSTEVTVEPVQGGGLLSRARGAIGLGPDRIRLRFEGVARPDAGGVVQELRQLASDLGAGSYRLQIAVTNRNTGETARNTTVFTVEQ